MRLWDNYKRRKKIKERKRLTLTVRVMLNRMDKLITVQMNIIIPAISNIYDTPRTIRILSDE